MRRWMGGILVFGALAMVACGGDDGGQRGPGSDDDVATPADDTIETTPSGDATTPPPDSGCEPACLGKQCGPDGCGGSCGSCADGYACQNALCGKLTDCTPQCEGKLCGPDGCEGSCGVCYSAAGAVDNSLCRVEGTCIDPTCVPACGGKTCGPDTCGGSCGTCAAYQQCESGVCAGEPPCGSTGLQAALQQTTLEDAGSGNKVFVHREYTSTSVPTDVLSLEDYLYAPYNGPTAPGVYDLSGQNYEDCGLCLVVSKNCSSSSCAKRFFQKSGTLEIIEYGGAGGAFKAVLNATLEEVTIDPTTYVSKPVPGGETWCFEDHVIDETIVAPAQLGEAVADFTLNNCYGEPLQLSSLKTSSAIWLTVVAGWCPSCDQWLPQVAANVAALKADGARLTHVTVLGEDNYSELPTQAFCVNYAEDHGLDPAEVYIDFQYDATFSHVDPYLGPNGEFAIPWDVLIKGTGLIYTWHSALASPTLESALTTLLNGN